MRSTLCVIGLILFGTAKTQCAAAISLSAYQGCAPLQVLMNCTNCSAGQGVWVVGTQTATGNMALLTLPTPGNQVVQFSFTPSGSTCVATASAMVTVFTGLAFGCVNTGAMEQKGTASVNWQVVNKRLHLNSGDEQGQPLHVLVRDITGRCVYEAVAIAHDLDTTTWPVGVYMVIVLTVDGQLLRQEKFLNQP